MVDAELLMREVLRFQRDARTRKLLRTHIERASADDLRRLLAETPTTQPTEQ